MRNHWLDTLPRTPLAHLPTPLHPLDRLSEHLKGPRIWLKRDDCTGLGTGGNKTRKLEFLLGEAQTLQADEVVTFGAVQSNHARQTAAACARLGLPCHLVLVRKVPWGDANYETLGNPQFDRLFGAQVHICGVDEANDVYLGIRRDCEARGQNLYTIPTGGSNAVGALGYVSCAVELLNQAETLNLTLTDIVHASASAGTQAGLLSGMASLDLLDDIRICGINVSESDNEEFEGIIFELGNEVLVRNQPDTRLVRNHVHTDPRFLGEGYGMPTDLTLEAIRLLGFREGILFDPVYSGKAIGGLIEQIRSGEYAGTNDVVFIHTGGIASLPVYGQVL